MGNWVIYTVCVDKNDHILIFLCRKYIDRYIINYIIVHSTYCIQVNAMPGKLTNFFLAELSF